MDMIVLSHTMSLGTKIFLALLFLYALLTTFFFLGRLVTWAVYKINPDNCKKEFTDKEVRFANLIGVSSAVSWGIVFFELLYWLA